MSTKVFSSLSFSLVCTSQLCEFVCTSQLCELLACIRTLLFVPRPLQRPVSSEFQRCGGCLGPAKISKGL